MSLRSLSCSSIMLLSLLACYCGSLNSQSQCFIKTENSFSLNSQPRSSENSTSQKYYDRIAWFDLGQTQLADDLCTKLFLSPGQKSEALVVSGWNFNIPSTAIITGIDARFYGKKEGAGTVKDLKIQLVDASGNKVGLNKANKSLKGKPWNQEPSLYNYWSYGSERDNWGYEWTAEEINNPNFGISVELLNRSQDNAKVLLDQLLLTVYYEAAIDFCEDRDFIALFDYEEPSVKSYVWDIPSQLNHEVVDYLPSSVVIFADDSEYGDYSICLTKEYYNGDEEQCCSTLNFRNCNKGSIGDFVWHDRNGNGLQDVGEPGIDNERIYLYNESMKFLDQTTTVDGYYNFDNLDPGSYFLKVKINDLEITTSNTSDDDRNSDFFEFLEDKMSRLIVVEAGQHINNIDFGFADRGGVAGFTWLDKNANGFFESEDELLSGVKVNLLDANGSLINSNISDNKGEYKFFDLLPGTYQIEFDAASEYYASSLGMENNMNKNFYTNLFSINVGIMEYFNAAFYRKSSIAGNVWMDIDADNVRDAGDYNLTDMTVKLKDCDDNLLESLTTDEDGNYLFSDLDPNQYVVCIENDRQDIYIPKAIECTTCYSLKENENIEADDFIFNQDLYYTIKLNIFNDFSDDNILDGNETGISGVVVNLTNCSDSLILSSISDSHGEVTFELLNQGDYVISLEYDPTFALSKNSEFIIESNNVIYECFSVSGDKIVNLGLTKYSSIGDLVWFDKNNNGLQDGAEMGLEGIHLTLFDADENIVGETTSDINGNYFFEQLPSGQYYVAVLDLESLFDLTVANDTDSEFNSDFFKQSGRVRTDWIELAVFEEMHEIDLGLIAAVSNTGTTISGNIWRDSNGDLEQVSENNMSDVAVSLYNCDDELIGQTITDIDGYYSFENIPDGSYYIVMESVSGSTIYFSDSELQNTEEGKSECFDLSGSEIVVEVAYVPMSSLGDYVWLDTNVNGVQDNNESGVADLDIILLDNDNNIIAGTTTDDEGNYLFENILPGSYVVEIIDKLDVYTPTLQAIGTSDKDSELRLDQGRYVSEIIELEDGVERLDLDLGLNFHQSIMGGTVFIDNNMDGTRSGVEKGLAGLAVELLDDQLNTLQSTLTDSDGIYRFYNIFPGEYYVRFQLPIDYIFTPYHLGGDELFDSDVMSDDGLTALISIIGNNVIEGVNAGLIRSNACISGTYWIDMNEDGILEVKPGSITSSGESNQKSSSVEPIVAGAVVNLYNESGDLVATDVTDALGQYMICDIESGFYYVSFELISGFVFTTANAIGDELLDSDVLDEDGLTEIFEIKSGMTVNGINAGIHVDNTLPNATMNDEYEGDMAVGKFDEDGVFRVTPNPNYNAESLSHGIFDDESYNITLESRAQESNTDIKYLASPNEERWSYVFPNPVVGDELNLIIDSKEDIKNINYRIFDMSGSQVISYNSQQTYTKGKHQFVIPIINFAQGVYTLQLRINNRTENHRIVIFSR